MKKLFIILIFVFIAGCTRPDSAIELPSLNVPKLEVPEIYEGWIEKNKTIQYK
jgi:hypothetical protein